MNVVNIQHLVTAYTQICDPCVILYEPAHSTTRQQTTGGEDSCVFTELSAFSLIVIDLVLIVIVQEGVCETARRRGLTLPYDPRVVPGCGGLWCCGNCGCRGQRRCRS